LTFWRNNQTIFNRLDDKRNWISEWTKIKKSIPENCVKKLKSDDNEKIKKSLGLKIDSNLNIRNHNNKPQMITFSSTSTIFFSKMLLKMCFNSFKTCLIL
jgi:hypothetical protein